MNAGIISFQPVSSQSTSVGGHDLFRAHSLSFLVAVSVLMGAMFTAHSTILKLVSINAGEVAFGIVLDVRSEISALPERASKRMAAVGSYDAKESVQAYENINQEQHFSFESGLEGLFASTISFGEPLLVAHAPIYDHAGSNKALYGQFEPLATHRVVSSVGNGGLSVGEALRDSTAIIWPEITVLVDNMAALAVSGKEVSIAAFVQGVYTWVEYSPRVANILVVRTSTAGYVIAEATIDLISNSSNTYALALDLWRETTANVARPIADTQLKAGEALLSVLVNTRQGSADLQNVVGERVATIATYTYSNTFELVEITPGTATASVADFLTLEQK